MLVEKVATAYFFVDSRCTKH